MRVPSATLLGWMAVDTWPGSVALSHLLHVPQIRRSMIDGNDGQRFIKTLIKSLDEVTLQGKRVTAKTVTVLSTQHRRWGGTGCVQHWAWSRGLTSPRWQDPALQRPDWLPLTRSNTSTRCSGPTRGLPSKAPTTGEWHCQSTHAHPASAGPASALRLQLRRFWGHQEHVP